MGNRYNGRAEAVQRLVEFFENRKGDMLATPVGGEACKVDAVRNLSTDHRAVLEIVLETDQVLRYEGSASDLPGLGEDYFDIGFVDARVSDINQSFGGGGEGTIPKRIEICDDGYASLHGEMSMAAPRDPELALTLVDTGAEEFNRPILEARIEELQRERAEKQRRYEAQCAQREREQEEALAQLTTQIRQFFGPTIDIGVEMVGTSPRYDGVTLVVSGKKLTFKYDANTRRFEIDFS